MEVNIIETIRKFLQNINQYPWINNPEKKKYCEYCCTHEVMMYIFTTPSIIFEYCDYFNVCNECKQSCSI